MSFSQLKSEIVTKLENELPPGMYYHNANHTLGVLNACERFIEHLQLPAFEAKTLLTAALFHDTGFLWTYADHEERGIEFAREVLPRWNYILSETEAIVKIIRATKVPQKPNGLLEEIICDADLYYLGTDSFGETNELLYQELMVHDKIHKREEWMEMQIQFLENHHYFTEFARKHLEPVKQKHLKALV